MSDCPICLSTTADTIVCWNSHSLCKECYDTCINSDRTNNRKCAVCREAMFKWDEDTDPITGEKALSSLSSSEAHGRGMFQDWWRDSTYNSIPRQLQAMPSDTQRFVYRLMVGAPNPSNPTYRGFRTRANFQRYGRDWRDWGRKLCERLSSTFVWSLVNRGVKFNKNVRDGIFVECNIAERNDTIWSVSMRPLRNRKQFIRTTGAGGRIMEVWCDSELVPWNEL